MVIGFGLVFEAPLILITLSLFGIIDSQMLSGIRRYVIVGCFVISALITPPDWVSQIGMAIPLFFMYEIAVVIIKFLERKKKKEKKESE